MIDMGDLQGKGIFFKNEGDTIMETMAEVLGMSNIELYGVGVNLTCYGAIIPKADNLGGLVAIARKIEEKFGIKLKMVSGGKLLIHLSCRKEGAAGRHHNLETGGILPSGKRYRIPHQASELLTMH